jgi:hypothetical protein
MKSTPLARYLRFVEALERQFPNPKDVPSELKTYCDTLYIATLADATEEELKERGK